MAWFEVLQGFHSEGPKDDQGKNPMYGPLDENGEWTTKDGPYVDSQSDLTKHNLPGVPPKYKKMNPSEIRKAGLSPTASQPLDDLDAKNVPELRKVAEAEKIDLGDYTKKQDIIDWIRECREGAVQEAAEVAS